MTTAVFKHIDLAALPAGTKPWSKVDTDASSFQLAVLERAVTDLRGREREFTTDSAGFEVVREPAAERAFADDAAIRDGYYGEVEALLRRHLPGQVRRVVIFDHTIRRRTPGAARSPVEQVHVDQTPGAAEARVRRHLPPGPETEALLRGRYQIVNVWRPIGHAASDAPLAVVDWRSTVPDDFVPVDLLYPARADRAADDDDRGREVRPEDASRGSTAGYEVRGETMAVRPSDAHRFYYQRDMTPDEVLLLKCYDSFGEGQPLGKKGIAVRTPHTAFTDPATPKDAPGRQSIEVRCLVFYE